MNDSELQTALEIVDFISRSGRFFHYKMLSGRYRLLTILLEHGNSIAQMELQEELNIKSGSMSEIISKIEQDELIERCKNPNDGRQVIICLTDGGVSEAKRIKAEYEEKVRAMFDGFSETEKLHELLKELYENAAKMFRGCQNSNQKRKEV